MQEGDLGTISMGVIYTSFTLFTLTASPVVRWLGASRALVVGTSGYPLFILANLVPTWCVADLPLLGMDAWCLLDRMPTSASNTDVDSIQSDIYFLLTKESDFYGIPDSDWYLIRLLICLA